VSANPEKGETDVVIEGVTYTLVMTFNGLIDCQNALAVNGAKPTVGQILERVSNQDVEAFRAVFWGTLRRHHPGVSLQQAGDLMDASGGMPALDMMLAQVSAQSAPDPNDVKAAEVASGRPPKAAKAARTRTRGIGARLR
jgi:hypothetical protein